MTSIEQNLTQYAAYHRDRRNIATHFVGVPMIVFSIVLALDFVAFNVNGVHITIAALACIAATIYYVILERTLGLTMAVVLFLMCALASEVSARVGAVPSLGVAAAIFVVGWIIQFVGHKYEGMKPAFFDDAKQLLIGPLFVCAEAFFFFGALPEIRRYIEERVGPTAARRDGRPLPLVDI